MLTFIADEENTDFFLLQMKPMLITDEVNVNFAIAEANIDFFIADEINVDFCCR